MKEIDISGQRFHMLVAIKKSRKKDAYGKRLWSFLCDCGKVVYLTRNAVIYGGQKSCGCLGRKMVRVRADALTVKMVGVRIGSFVVVGQRQSEDGAGSMCTCRCDCGHEFSARGKLLRNRQIRHCPRCFKVETRARPTIESLAGTRFGRLTIIKGVGSEEGKGRIMKCRCDCGKTTKVPFKYLRSGNTKSCGCLNRESIRKNADRSRVKFSRLIQAGVH
jgi:hypothetical protein